MPKVAILYMDRYSGYDCDHEIVRSITDWKEVTQEERDALRMYVDRVPHAVMLEQMADEQFPLTLAKALIAAEKYKKAEEERKAKASAARAKAAATRSEKERLKYEELKKRFEG